MAKETKDVAAALKMIKEKDVKYVDLRFTDPRGKMQHLTMDVSQMGEDAWAEGLMFDGSSIAGWKAINESDMLLMPDPTTAQMDPFFAASTLSIVCDVLDPISGEPYNRDPRSIAKKAWGFAHFHNLVTFLARRDPLAAPMFSANLPLSTTIRGWERISPWTWPSTNGSASTLLARRGAIMLWRGGRTTIANTRRSRCRSSFSSLFSSLSRAGGGPSRRRRCWP